MLFIVSSNSFNFSALNSSRLVILFLISSTFSSSIAFKIDCSFFFFSSSILKFNICSNSVILSVLDFSKSFNDWSENYNADMVLNVLEEIFKTIALQKRKG